MTSVSLLAIRRDDYRKLLEVDGCTVPLSKLLALRLSSNTKPHNGKIACLQKGLRLVYDEEEVVGEGTGFGFPVLLYSTETYFSSSSRVYRSDRDAKTIRKEFLMDAVSRKRIGHIRLQNRKLRIFWRWLAGVHQKHKRLGRLLELTNVSWKMGLRTGFYKTVPAGKVIVTYRVNGSRIHVRTLFSLVRKEKLRKIFILNEQGSSFFRRYIDSNGTELTDEKIDAWKITEADHATITDVRGGVGFQLPRIENTILRVGREFIENYIDWVGLDYELSPRTDVFEYEIQVLGV